MGFSGLGFEVPWAPFWGLGFRCLPSLGSLRPLHVESGLGLIHGQGAVLPSNNTGIVMILVIVSQALGFPVVPVYGLGFLVLV